MPWKPRRYVPAPQASPAQAAHLDALALAIRRKREESLEAALRMEKCSECGLLGRVEGRTINEEPVCWRCVPQT